jgi:hypothetical protein
MKNAPIGWQSKAILLRMPSSITLCNSLTRNENGIIDRDNWLRATHRKRRENRVPRGACPHFFTASEREERLEETDPSLKGDDCVEILLLRSRP